MADGVSLSIAAVAGGLATVNPCGFPLLPAFLSFYTGAQEDQLPRAPGRIAQGLAVGALVTGGFLAVFALAGLPIVLGARFVADLVPWAGLAIGVVLALVGIVALAGRHVSLGIGNRLPVLRQRRAPAMLLFGAGYGMASLGCTLPLFLALVGASLGAEGVAPSLWVFLAYAAGMTVVLTALSVGAALAREGLARGLRRLLPHMGRISGALLVLAGTYLTYYWLRLELGETATIADDPIVGFGTRFTARIQALAFDAGGPILIVAAVAVGLALAAVCLRWSRRRRAGARNPLPLAALAVALVLAGCGGGSEESEGEQARPNATAGLTDITSVEQFRTRFNESAGKPRLVLLLAPT